MGLCEDRGDFDDPCDWPYSQASNCTVTYAEEAGAPLLAFTLTTLLLLCGAVVILGTSLVGALAETGYIKAERVLQFCGVDQRQKPREVNHPDQVRGIIFVGALLCLFLAVDHGSWGRLIQWQVYQYIRCALGATFAIAALVLMDHYIVVTYILYATTLTPHLKCASAKSVGRKLIRYSIYIVSVCGYVLSLPAVLVRVGPSGSTNGYIDRPITAVTLLLVDVNLLYGIHCCHRILQFLEQANQDELNRIQDVTHKETGTNGTLPVARANSALQIAVQREVHTRCQSIQGRAKTIQSTRNVFIFVSAVVLGATCSILPLVMWNSGDPVHHVPTPCGFGAVTGDLLVQICILCLVAVAGAQVAVWRTPPRGAPTVQPETEQVQWDRRSTTTGTSTVGSKPNRLGDAPKQLSVLSEQQPVPPAPEETLDPIASPRRFSLIPSPRHSVDVLRMPQTKQIMPMFQMGLVEAGPVWAHRSPPPRSRLSASEALSVKSVSPNAAGTPRGSKSRPTTGIPGLGPL